MKYMLIFIGIIGILIALALILPTKPVAQVSTIVLEFTSPGDDGDVGTASSYELRYSTTPVGADTTAWWNAATIYPNMPQPLVAGTLTTVNITPATPFLTGNTYYFIMKACDEVPNCSGYSNVATKLLPDMIPPARIVNLSAQ